MVLYFWSRLSGLEVVPDSKVTGGANSS